MDPAPVRRWIRRPTRLQAPTNSKRTRVPLTRPLRRWQLPGNFGTGNASGAESQGRAVIEHFPPGMAFLPGMVFLPGLEAQGTGQAGSLSHRTAVRGFSGGTDFQWDGLPGGTDFQWDGLPVGRTSSPSRPLAFQANIPAPPSPAKIEETVGRRFHRNGIAQWHRIPRSSCDRPLLAISPRNIRPLLADTYPASAHTPTVRVISWRTSPVHPARNVHVGFRQSVPIDGLETTNHRNRTVIEIVRAEREFRP